MCYVLYDGKQSLSVSVILFIISEYSGISYVLLGTNLFKCYIYHWKQCMSGIYIYDVYVIYGKQPVCKCSIYIYDVYVHIWKQSQSGNIRVSVCEVL